MMEYLSSWSASDEGKEASARHGEAHRALDDIRRAVTRYCVGMDAYTALHPNGEEDSEQTLGILIGAVTTAWALHYPTDWVIQMEMTEEAVDDDATPLQA